MSGYLSQQYAASLGTLGTSRLLPGCLGYILERPIPGSMHRDAMGCYPLFCCESWTGVAADLQSLAGELVSVCLVADPFGNYGIDDLRGVFDKVVGYKEHFVTDLRRSLREIVSSHHRYYARRGLRNVRVELCEEPAEHSSEWSELYAAFAEKREFSGPSLFSKPCLEAQLEVPGVRLFRALDESATVGMQVWYVQGDVAYWHLSAYTDAAYRMRASYAVFWRAIEYFADQKLCWLHLGGVPDSGSGGLAAFKKGWSTGTRTAYLCGRILSEPLYEEITTARGAQRSDYFPAYRRGEF